MHVLINDIQAAWSAILGALSIPTETLVGEQGASTLAVSEASEQCRARVLRIRRADYSTMYAGRVRDPLISQEELHV